MTPSEFKAWFEGYSEAIEGAPTTEQFAKIREKVRQIEDRPKPPLNSIPRPRGEVFAQPAQTAREQEEKLALDRFDGFIGF